MASVTVRKAAGIGLTDAAALLFIYLVPTLSHLTAVPFYLIDPMRIAVLGALLATKNWKNALVLAVTLPLFSSAIGMHPVFPKCLLIAVELAANVLLFVWLARKLNAGIAAFISILCSKLLYYGLKAAVLYAGLLQMELISTGLWIQFAVAVLISVAFGIWFVRE